tara:strand:- start:45 stop:518 length:474 start_codon:yes stop_codon:yes gene_type:complete
VKIGQYIASRSDLVAPPIVRHLSRMLDANPPRPLSQTMRTLASELGERASAIESFDPTPLSTASIAQACTVHRGHAWAMPIPCICADGTHHAPRVHCTPRARRRACTVRIPCAPPRAHRALYQVHAARLRGGAKVVVKLQHVEVARVMRQDMVQSLV